jgi:hypothetical protein
MLRTASRLVLAAGALAAGAAGAMMLRADVMIGYGFSRAFEARTGAPPFQMAAGHSDGSSGGRAEVGDEAYWLRRGDAIARPVVLSGRPVVGQRIVDVSAEDGRTRYLEVVAVNVVGTPIVNVSDGPPTVRLMRITFRVFNPQAPGTEKEELVHLWFQTEAKPITPVAQEPPLRGT